MKNLIKQILREETSVNTKEDKLKSLIFKFINRSVEGADIYHHDSGIWIIFTNQKRWVINFKENGELYYNYYFFQNIFNFFSMDVVENQHYITEWVEDTIKNGVKYTIPFDNIKSDKVEDTIKNGVKYTLRDGDVSFYSVEGAIKNGIKLNKS